MISCSFAIQKEISILKKYLLIFITIIIAKLGEKML